MEPEAEIIRAQLFALQDEAYRTFHSALMPTVPPETVIGVRVPALRRLAKQLAEKNGGKRVSAQAVGGAVGHNPISLMIPCHRVVGTNGSLTGYGGGIQRKKALLELERADMHGLFVPKKGTAL